MLWKIWKMLDLYILVIYVYNLETVNSFVNERRGDARVKWTTLKTFLYHGSNFNIRFIKYKEHNMLCNLLIFFK